MFYELKNIFTAQFWAKIKKNVKIVKKCKKVVDFVK